MYRNLKNCSEASLLTLCNTSALIIPDEFIEGCHKSLEYLKKNITDCRNDETEYNTPEKQCACFENVNMTEKNADLRKCRPILIEFERVNAKRRKKCTDGDEGVPKCKKYVKETANLLNECVGGEPDNTK